MSEANKQRDLQQPEGGRSFEQLIADLRPRPRYLGPGKWKQALKRLLAEEEKKAK